MTVAKRKREEDKEKAERTNNSINRYFSNGPAAAAPKPKVSSSTQLHMRCTESSPSLLLLSKMLLSWQIS